MFLNDLAYALRDTQLPIDLDAGTQKIDNVRPIDASLSLDSCSVLEAARSR